MASSKEAGRFDTLVTEARRGERRLRPPLDPDLVELMNEEDASCPRRRRPLADELAAAIDAIVDRLDRGGRLVYVGAGSSGWIAELDADECEATFSTDPGQIVALLAGADSRRPSMRPPRTTLGPAGSARGLAVAAADAVIGVSASGRTPYALAALEAPAEAGALTVVLSAVGFPARRAPPTTRSRSSRGRVCFRLDPAQGRHGTEARLEHDLDRDDGSAGQDLRRPDGRRALLEREAPSPGTQGRRLATGVSPDEAEQALAEADGSAKVAIVSLLTGLDAGPPGRGSRRRQGTSDRRSSDEARRRSGARRWELVPGDVEVVEGLISATGWPRQRARLIAVPGFVDLQVNGFGGVDLMRRTPRATGGAARACSRPA